MVLALIITGFVVVFSALNYLIYKLLCREYAKMYAKTAKFYSELYKR